MDKRVDYTITIKASYETARGSSKLPKRLIKEVLAFAKLRLAYQKGQPSGRGNPERSPNAVCLGVTAQLSEYQERQLGPKRFWTNEKEGREETLYPSGIPGKGKSLSRKHSTSLEVV